MDPPTLSSRSRLRLLLQNRVEPRTPATRMSILENPNAHIMIMIMRFRQEAYNTSISED